MKLVILDGYTTNPGDMSWEPVSSLCDEFIVYDRTAPEEVLDRVSDAQLVITNKTVLSGDVIRRFQKAKYIGLLSTGTNVVDIHAAAQMGITVCNVPEYSTQTVAQMVFALLSEICFHVGEHNNSVKKGEWTNNKDFCYWKTPLIELSGKTMGIIGYGKIGKATAKIAAAMGMRVIASGRTDFKNDGIAECVSFNDVLSQSDVISLHVPLTEQTKGLVNESTISMMKPGVILINTSRGPVVDEKALYNALSDGRIYAAGVDVVSAEPIKPDNPLLKADNCIITPHISWAAKETRARLIEITAGNLRSFLNGTPVNIVLEK